MPDTDKPKVPLLCDHAGCCPGRGQVRRRPRRLRRIRNGHPLPGTRGLCRD